MAYYNANRVIKLTRKALGLTQEKLSEGICEVETYSKIENGHRTIRRTTYQKLMEKMGRIVDRRYAVCVSKDGMLLDEKIELERAFKRYDYETAEKYLNILREKVDDNLLTRQYIARVEALVEYRKGIISAHELVKKLDMVMRITVPNYEEYLDKDSVFPFAKEELLVLMGLGNACRKNGEMERSRKLYKNILQCLDANYLGEPDNIAFKISVRNNLSMVYEKEKEYQKALYELDVCIELAVQIDYGHLLATLLVAKAYNINKLVKEREIKDESVVEIKGLSQRAYYLAVARGNDKVAESIKEFYCKIEEP